MLGKCFSAILSTFSFVHRRSSSSTNLQTTTHSFLKSHFLIYMQNWQPSHADDTKNAFLPQIPFPYSHAKLTTFPRRRHQKLVPSSNPVSLFACKTDNLPTQTTPKTCSFLKPRFLIHMQNWQPSHADDTKNVFLRQTLFPYSHADDTKTYSFLKPSFLIRMHAKLAQFTSQLIRKMFIYQQFTIVE